MLDTKYRPNKFSSVIGNDGTINVIQARLKNGTINNQSYMFGGPRGCGKTTLARITAMAMVCENLQDAEPCGECEQCKAVLDGSSQHVTEVDAASYGTVENVRGMIDNASYYYTSKASNIYILDEAQRLSAAAQDALLKAIEDRKIHVMLCTTEPHKIKKPIRSRVEEYCIKKPSEVQLVNRIKKICIDEKVPFDDVRTLVTIAKMSDMIPRSSIIAIDTLVNMGGVNKSNVDDLFNVSDYRMLDDALYKLSVFDKLAFDVIEKINQSPEWLKQNIITAISNDIRLKLGLSSQYKYIYSKYESDLSSILDELVPLNKPNVYDIVALLIGWFVKMEKSGYVKTVATNVQVVQNAIPQREPSVVQEKPQKSPPVSNATETKKEQERAAPEPRQVAKKTRSIEVDGIKFNDSESLTTLDGKIKPIENDTKDINEVYSMGDTSTTPMPVMDFISEFKKLQ